MALETVKCRLDPQSVRHTETNYDDLLVSGFERGEARYAVQSVVSLTLDAWEHGGS